MTYKVDMATKETRQGVQFKVNVSKSEYGENLQFVQGLLHDETPTHITVENPWRGLQKGGINPQFRTYKKSRIINGKYGIMRMNF